MREWWRRKSPEEKRTAIATRDPKRVREQDRRKMAKRRTGGSPAQLLRIEARKQVRLAKARGDLIPQSCERDSDDCKGWICAHHDDYSKPLDVRWFCRKHHDEHHAKMAV